jgi:hypothetical protein
VQIGVCRSVLTARRDPGTLLFVVDVCDDATMSLSGGAGYCRAPERAVNGDGPAIDFQVPFRKVPICK